MSRFVVLTVLRMLTVAVMEEKANIAVSMALMIQIVVRMEVVAVSVA